MPNKKMILRGLSVVLREIFLALAAVFLLAGIYKQVMFPKSQLAEMIFYWNFGLGSIIDRAALVYMAKVGLVCLAIWFVIRIPIMNLWKNRVRIRVTTSPGTAKEKTRLLNPSKWGAGFKFGYALVWFLGTSIYASSAFMVPQYLMTTDLSRIYEDQWVNPSSVKIVPPEKPRNLIFIYLESMENTLLSKKNGGQLEDSLVPELEQLALDPANVSFSNRADTLGGALPVAGTGWSLAGMVATAGGIPLKPSIGNDGGALDEFLPGAYMLGDVLANQGYEQSLVLGTDPAFGGLDKLMTRHGKFNMLVPQTLKAAGRLPQDYYKWWGFEDRKMFSFAREEATRLAGTGKPFHLQLFSEDTHHPHGYNDPECTQNPDDLYSSSYQCTSTQIVDFVRWAQAQPFAANTTIVLVGDHNGHLTNFYEKKITDKNYKRTTYNVILNSAKRPEHMRSRNFTSMDFYPTILSAMGYQIPGNRLALGVDLFSKDRTLAERIGIQKLDDELNKRSSFYDVSLLKQK